MNKRLWNWSGNLYYLLFVGVFIFLLEFFRGGSGWLESALLALVVIIFSPLVMVVTRWLVRKMMRRTS